MNGQKSTGDRDVAIAMVIALALLIIVTCIWPGFARVRASGLAGYWRSESSSGHPLYEIRAEGGREFIVEKPGSDIALAGRALRIRGVEIPALKKEGSVELGGRHINWTDGDVWVRQGI